ncbi:uncharacterized protein LOC8288047 isoform X2 [Ricinus communis]|uniref:Uncharacterized protein n=1 Tax=Ricinus communis TaxID=3988 RepID=B9RCV4_RICCO|nr:uncharacterized protein LOC8288047 isoform X2 [Ricinus communis]EEF51375.1 conserved hypothetical protein [Ricinus communis]|eukprot:XP_025012307.1 uncharacterized protein LOC8288047 isoform X2 [Ricinus communis]
MAITLVSVPTINQTLSSQRPYNTNLNTLTLTRYSSIKSITFINRLCSSSSSSTSVVEEDGPASTPDDLPVQSPLPPVNADEVPVGGCKACGRQEIEKGCNGEGRIQGGIATVSGFGWWPIKAYRPCPGFVASGGRYRRQGQSMDEVVSGRGNPGTPVGSSTEVESSKERQDPRKFKR